MVLRVRVASSSSRVAKLWMGWPLLSCGGRFGQGRRGAAGGGDGVGAAGLSSVKQIGAQSLAQVPDEVEGEHADEHVGADPVSVQWWMGRRSKSMVLRLRKPASLNLRSL